MNKIQALEIVRAYHQKEYFRLTEKIRNERLEQVKTSGHLFAGCTVADKNGIKYRVSNIIVDARAVPHKLLCQRILPNGLPVFYKTHLNVIDVTILG